MKKHRNGENRHRCIKKYLIISVILGKRALPEKDRQKERQEEVCECMNMIADEICRIYGSYGFTWNRDGDKKLFGADYQYVARYLTADMNAASPDPEISIGIYGKEVLRRKLVIVSA